MSVKSDVSQQPVKAKRQWLAKEPAAPGTKRWYREQRVEHLTLWMVPLFPVFYTLSGQGVDQPWQSIVAMLLPVVGSGVALGFVSHALWRIEINVKGNREHPFTPKDERVLARASWLMFFSLAFAVVVDFAASLLSDDLVPSIDEHHVDIATNTAVVVAFVGVTLTSTMKRIHHKGWHAWEAKRRAEAELEKGV